ncbi:hypothetical protein OG883_08965 [Streptomyces sp. NBC_01142]|uniref:hypothetical protein n=1 Tax=Streptomyces sp. NBC_01142 TaxID=2975865 RepID=UPI00224E97C6|nr:hypothetical protein [Streptomyces sp. NBC_01142]MCX4820032.1 hypothetical protein [Streptomyces sp. NBC_01142]
MTDRTDRTLELLRQQPRLAGLAAFPFHFDLRRAEHAEEAVLASGATLEPIAGDDTGGTFFVCGGGPVLYASPDGQAGLLGDSVAEALEVIVGLPGWYDCVHLAPVDGEERLVAEIVELEHGIRSSYGPERDSGRAELRTALGLPERSPVELIGRLHGALLRTDPDHVLLSARELMAYKVLHDRVRTPLRDVVLAPGRADLARMRADRAPWDTVAGEAVRRATVLRAAQYDRRDGDLPLLRRLLRAEAEAGNMSEELRLAAVLIAVHGLAEDLPLLHAVRETSPHIRSGLWELPGAPAPMAAWARSLDIARFGQDPAQEPEFTWTGLARRQGRSEHVRIALIRMLDDTGPDAERLSALSRELEQLGAFAQAARAQRNVVSLKDTAWDRAMAGHSLARLERSAGDLAAAWRALGRVRTAIGVDKPGPLGVDKPGPRPVGSGKQPGSARGLEAPPKDTTAEQWHRLGLGQTIVKEHLRLVLSAVESGERDLALEAMAHTKVLLTLIGKEFHRKNREELNALSREAKWAVAQLKNRAAAAE